MNSATYAVEYLIAATLEGFERPHAFEAKPDVAMGLADGLLQNGRQPSRTSAHRRSLSVLASKASAARAEVIHASLPQSVNSLARTGTTFSSTSPMFSPCLITRRSLLERATMALLKEPALKHQPEAEPVDSEP